MTMQIVGIILSVVTSYLIGSVNFAIIISRYFRKSDVRSYGSGGAGSTNMVRTYGKPLGALTALGDGLKGVVAVLLTRNVIVPLFNITVLDLGYIAAIFVLLGHVFPVFFGFRGGKGVMTCLGVILCLDPLIFVALVAIAVPLVMITRIVSIGSMVGAVLFPVFTFISRFVQHMPIAYDTICAIILAVIVIIMHRDNIARLKNGTENKFVKKISQED